MAAIAASKRDTILDQAIHAFAELGFQKTDVQVIADRSGVGKGTVYRYFGNKDDLFWASVHAVLERLEQYLDQSMAGAETPQARLQAAGEAFGRFFAERPDYLEVFVQDRAQFRGHAPQPLLEFHQRLLQRFAAILDEGIALGQFVSMDVSETILMMAASLYGCVLYPGYQPGQAPLAPTAARITAVFLKGIAR